MSARDAWADVCATLGRGVVAAGACDVAGLRLVVAQLAAALASVEGAELLERRRRGRRGHVIVSEGAELLRASGHSCRSAGALLGVSRQAVHRWREGRAIPGAAHLEALRERLGIPPEAWRTPSTPPARQ